MPSEEEIDNFTSEADLENTLTNFLKGVRIVIDQKEDSALRPGSAVLIDLSRLLVYGEPHAHATVKAFLEALRDDQLDIVKVAGCDLSSEERASLKALQKLTAIRWKMRAKAREDAAAKVVRGYVERDLREASWQLLAEAVQGSVNLEALTILQVAWDNPQINEAAPLLVTRAAWCIGIAAQALPNEGELTTLADRAFSTVKAMKVLKPKNDDVPAYLASLYAALLLGDRGASGSQVDDIVKSLMMIPENSSNWIARLIAQGWFSPSAESDLSLIEAISARRIDGDDGVLLISLLAKRRGGQLWQTFREEMPSLVRAQPLNGHVVVLVNRLEGSPSAFGIK